MDDTSEAAPGQPEQYEAVYRHDCGGCAFDGRHLIVGYDIETGAYLRPVPVCVQTGVELRRLH